jgi:hypothetical protein
MTPDFLELLDDINDYLDARADVNHEGDGPNTAMRLQRRLKKVLDSNPADACTTDAC